MKTTSKNKGNCIYADVSGNRLPFKSQSINNLCGIDISQPTPSESLSVPLFSLGFDPCVSFPLVLVHSFIFRYQFMSSFGPQKNLSRITAPFATQIKNIFALGME